MKKKKQSKPQAPDVKTMGEAIDFIMTLPGIAEAFTRADVELALDDRGWIVSPGKGFVNADIDDNSRMILVSKSRLYWQKDPLAKQAVRLWTDYALGDGMTYKATDDAVQAELDAFCKNKKNRRIMSTEGQRKASKKLLVDGEIFYAVFDEPTGKEVRQFDPLQITRIITDPDDEDRILGYKRVTAKDKVLFYVDWAADDDDMALLKQQKDPDTGKMIEPEDGVVLYHLAFDALHHRGNGLLFPALDWAKEHRRFMEARVAIVQALSKFAWKATVKGGQSALTKIKQDLQSTYALTGATQTERNPVNAPGGTWLQNAAMDLAQMPRTTGGSEAKSDGDNLKLMVSAGTGIMLHYFGDPSTGNLATATAMELPMLKQFSSYQKFWTDFYQDLFSIVLGDDDVDEADDQEDEASDEIDIDLPPILQDDLQKLGAFLTAATGMFPELKVDAVLTMLLTSLGINNVQEVMEQAQAQRELINSNAAKGLDANGQPFKTQIPAFGNDAAQEVSKLTEAMNQVLKLLKGD